MAGGPILALDQGTTSSRAIVFGADLRHPAASASASSPSTIPASGWVEHDPEDIWRTTRRDRPPGARRRQARRRRHRRHRHHQPARDLRRSGTGAPASRSTAPSSGRTGAPPTMCRELKAAGHEPAVTAKTGLLLDPYFSATKIAWLLDHVRGRARAGARPATSPSAPSTPSCSGASPAAACTPPTPPTPRARCSTTSPRALRTTICCALFGVPRAAAARGARLRRRLRHDRALDPRRRRCRSCGVAGDQQAATIGQACFAPGMVKATYGTGCFALLNTGAEPVASSNRLLTTVAYQLDGKRTYALEGAIFIAGAAVQWLRDGLKHHRLGARERRARGQRRCRRRTSTSCPAFVGLGAPYWQPEARGALFGLTRATGPAEIARAALEAVCFQTRDLLEAMHGDWASGRPSRCCASTAAWWRATGPCSAWPTSSMRRSSGRRCRRPRRWARPGSPATRRACGPTRTASPSSGSSSAPSSRRSPPPSGSASIAGWKRAVAAVLDHAASVAPAHSRSHRPHENDRRGALRARPAAPLCLEPAAQARDRRPRGPRRRRGAGQGRRRAGSATRISPPSTTAARAPCPPCWATRAPASSPRSGAASPTSSAATTSCSSSSPSCGTCRNCARGKPNVCQRWPEMRNRGALLDRRPAPQPQRHDHRPLLRHLLLCRVRRRRPLLAGQDRPVRAAGGCRHVRLRRADRRRRRAQHRPRAPWRRGRRDRPRRRRALLHAGCAPGRRPAHHRRRSLRREAGPRPPARRHRHLQRRRSRLRRGDPRRHRRRRRLRLRDGGLDQGAGARHRHACARRLRRHRGPVAGDGHLSPSTTRAWSATRNRSAAPTWAPACPSATCRPSSSSTSRDACRSTA